MVQKGVRIWQKKQLRLDTLTFRQREMVKIGATGLLDVFRRISLAQGPTDAPAKPLKKRYAIWKTRKHLGNKRNLRVTGAMLANLKLRTVTDNSARAGLTSAKERIKGWANMKRQAWLVWSPANRRAIMQKAGEILAMIKNNLVIQKPGTAPP